MIQRYTNLRLLHLLLCSSVDVVWSLSMNAIYTPRHCGRDRLEFDYTVLRAFSGCFAGNELRAVSYDAEEPS